MLKVFFFLGLTLTIGSGVIVYDYTQQDARTPGGKLEMGAYFKDMQNRVVDLMEKDSGPRIAALPQVSRTMSAARDDAWSNMSSSEQIDDFVSGSPQLQAMVAADRKAAKESWWARIRQKVTNSDAPRADRLAGIRDRNFPQPREGLDPAALANMSVAEIAANRRAISEGLTNTAANRMNGFVDDMKELGMDPNDYRDFKFD